MTLAKAVTKTLDIGVKDTKIDLSAIIKSYDLTDTKFIFNIVSNQGLSIDLTGSTAMYIVEYVHNSQVYAIQGEVDIVDSTTIAFNLPEDLKGYKGTVLIGLYVQMTDGTKIDIKDIIARIEPSIIDKDIDFSAKTYFKDFESIKAEVVLEGEKAKTSINAVVSDVNGYGNLQKQTINDVVSDVNGYGNLQKQTINDVVSDVQSTGVAQKEAINNVLTDVQSTGETAKVDINAILPTVQSTADTAKTDINAVLPTVQSQVSELDRQIKALPQIPDLYVAYADYKSGNGFSKTDSSKLYKGYGVKNSDLATDYRWERNVDNLQVGGRNLYHQSSDYTFAGDQERTSTTTKVREKYGFKSEYKTARTSNVRLQQLQFNGINHAVVSFNAYVNTGTLKVDTDICDCYGNGSFIITTTNDRYSAFVDNINKYNTPAALNGFVDFTFKLAEGQTLYVEYVMVEYATTSSSWSPAPEEKASATELDELKSYIGYTDSDIYGVEIDMTNRRFTRLAGAIGKNGGADFDNINAYKRRRCSVTNDGVVLAYCGEENFTESGVTYAEIVKNGVTYPIGTPVQAMVEQPKFYYKVVPLVLEPIANGKGYHMRKGRYYISDYPKAGFKVHPAFVRNGVEHDKIYLSAYEGSIYDESESAYLLNDEQVADFSADMLSSVANAKPCSGLTQNLTRSNARLLAHNRGQGWEQQTIQTVSLTQLLFLIEYAKFNMQDVLGMGVTQKRDGGSSNLAENTGSTTSLGNASGAVVNTNGIQIVLYRGEENPYGNIWKFVDGLNVMANGIRAAYVADHDFNDKQSAGSYADVGFTLAKTSGYVSAFGYSQDFDWLFLTSETTGNSSVPVGDYFWQNYTAADDGGWRTVRLGANWNDGSYAGGFGWSVSIPSVSRSRFLSGRLVYLGG